MNSISGVVQKEVPAVKDNPDEELGEFPHGSCSGGSAGSARFSQCVSGGITRNATG